MAEQLAIKEPEITSMQALSAWMQISRPGLGINFPASRSVRPTSRENYRAVNAYISRLNRNSTALVGAIFQFQKAGLIVPMDANASTLRIGGV